MTRKELLDALGEIYTPKFGDWELVVQHTLTEPTCPSATVRPEFAMGEHRFSGFTAWADDVDAAIDLALESAYRALIKREPYNLDGQPFSNRGDAEALAAIIAELDRKS